MKSIPAKFAFPLIISLFFLWAFIHNLEPILIPHLKKACQLTDFQSAFIDSSVYLAYLLMAIPAGLVMKKVGYKKGIIVGLLLYALGALLFIPAAHLRLYPFFLGALFVIATGCAFLETAANPYVTILGNAKSATMRLNFAQSFNGLGAFIAPLIGGKLILSGIEYSPDTLHAMNDFQRNAYLQNEADAVKVPYLFIALVVLLVAFLISRTVMPDVSESNTHAIPSGGFKKLLSYPHLVKGVVAQFFYVGSQVCVTSFFIRFAKFSTQTPEKDAAFLLGMSLCGFMIGRFVGTFLSRFIEASKLLMIYSAISICLLLVAMFSKGPIAIWALFAVPFFQSIMFPTIFSLAIRGLNNDTQLGSSLLVMAVFGGAVFPLLMGFISDIENIQVAYSIPVICLLRVLHYGWKGYK